MDSFKQLIANATILTESTEFGSRITTPGQTLWYAIPLDKGQALHFYGSADDYPVTTVLHDAAGNIVETTTYSDDVGSYDQMPIHFFAPEDGVWYVSLTMDNEGTGWVWGGTYFPDTQTLSGTATDEQLEGGESGDSILGADGSDTLYGHEGQDTLDGGAGNDWLDGGRDSDTYLFGPASGQDTIDASTNLFEYAEEQSIVDEYGDQWTDWFHYGATDVVQFAPGITSDQLRLSHISGTSDLLISIAGSDSTLTLSGYLAGWEAQQIDFHFSDGSVLEHQQILAMAEQQHVAAGIASATPLTAGDNLSATLNAAGEQDWYSVTLDAGSTLQVNMGGFDTYLYLYDAEGSLVAQNDDSEGSVGSQLVFNAQQAGTWYIAAAGFSDAFGDYSLTTSLHDPVMLTGTESAESLDGGLAADQLYGEGGDDTLYGGASEDTLDGGAGNDLLIGGEHSDTYLFGPDSGQDTIVASTASTADETDVIRFAPGIAREQLSFQSLPDSTDLVISMAGSDSSITLSGFLQDGAPAIEIQFDDGSTLSSQEILQLAEQQQFMAGITSAMPLGESIEATLELPGAPHWYSVEMAEGTVLSLEMGGFDTTLSLYDSHGTQVAFNDDGGVNLGSLLYFQAPADGVWYIAAAGYGDNTGTYFLSSSLTSPALLTGSAQDDALIGTPLNDTLQGAAGNDSLEGDAGQDVLDGGSGNDWMDGGHHEDTYLFGFGYGQDTIEAGTNFYEYEETVLMEDEWDSWLETIYWGATDIVEFTGEITREQLLLSRIPETNDLLVQLAGSDDSLTLSGFFNADPAIIDFHFSDGSSLSNHAIRLLVDNDDELSAGWTASLVQGGAGNDTLWGQDGNDTLEGGIGNDFLSGGYAADTYLFAPGDGQDTIEAGYNSYEDAELEWWYDQETGESYPWVYYQSARDVVRFAEGITPDQLSLSRVADSTDLLIQLAGSTDSITLSGFFNQEHKTIDLAFADGSVLDDASIRLMVDSDDLLESDRSSYSRYAYELQGGSGSDTLLGGEGDDNLQGGAGNDYLEGSWNDDTLDGGSGDDYLDGGSQADTYVFGIGSGQDTIAAGQNLYDVGQYVIMQDEWGERWVEYVESSATDVVQFGAGITVQTLLLSRVPGTNDLLIRLDGSPDSLCLSGYLNPDPQVVEFVFADGSRLQQAEILELAMHSEVMAGIASATALAGDISLQDSLEQFTERDWYAISLQAGEGIAIEAGGFAAGLSLYDSAGQRVLLNDVTDTGMALNFSSPTAGTWYLAVTGAYMAADNAPYTLTTTIRAAQTLDGSADGDALLGDLGDDLLQGNAGDDLLLGGAGADTLDGGSGNDWLDGEQGSDTYLFGVGSGQDSIEAGIQHHEHTDTHSIFLGMSADNDSAIDTIALAAGITPEQVQFSRILGSNDLLLRLAGSTDSLTLSGFFGDTPAPVALAFADGTRLAPEELRAEVTQQIVMAGIASARPLPEGGLTDSIELSGGMDWYAISLQAGDGFEVSLGGFDSLNGYLNIYDAAGNRMPIAGEVDGNPGSWLFFTAPSTGTWYLATAGYGSDIGNYQLQTLTTPALNLAGTSDSEELFGSDMADTLAGASGDDTLYGGWGNDSLLGDAGQDVLIGDDGRDTLDGGAGNDLMDGGYDADTYLFGTGSGQDTIEAGTNYYEYVRHDIELYSWDYQEDWVAYGATDRVQFTGGLTAADIQLSRIPETDDLLVSLSGSTDSLTLRGFLSADPAIIDFHFSDGSVLDHAAIRLLVDSDDEHWADGWTGTLLQGGAGNDSLWGSEGNDTLDGGSGNDWMDGGYHADTYLFDLGSGQDTIHVGWNTYEESETLWTVHDFGSEIAVQEEWREFGSTDIVQFGPGIDRQQLQLELINEGADLLVTFTGSTDSLTLADFVNEDPAVIELHFTDGSSLSREDLLSLASIQAGIRSAVALESGQPLSNQIAEVGERHWYSLQLEQDETAQVEMGGFDTCLYLYDAQGNLVASDDDSGSNLGSLLSFKAPQSGTWYLATAGFLAFSGDYQLAFNALPANAPVEGSIELDGVNSQGQTLGLINQLTDADGIASTQYQWFAGQQAIANATGEQLLLTQDQVGKQISVQVTLTDTLGAVTVREARFESLTANVNDLPAGEPAIQGDAVQGATLVADVSGINDADGLGNFSYQWLADNEVIDNATTDRLTLTQAQVGKAIRVEVSYRDSFNQLEQLSSQTTGLVVNSNDLPAGNLIIEGTAVQGATLAANTSGLSDTDGLGEFSYQWLADNQVIEGATSSSFTLTQAQVGKLITLEVGYRDGFGHDETLSASMAAAVGNINDLPTGQVVISGAAITGGTLTALSGTVADADGLGEFSWQWLRNGDPIAQADSASYSLTADDIGQQISVRLSYTDGGQESETLTSAAVVPTNQEMLLTEGDDQHVGTGGVLWLNALGGNDAITGTSGNDTINGGNGNDTLDGGAGSDSLVGGAGNDTFYVDSQGDEVIELLKAGNDHVFASLNWVLGDNLEYLTLTGSALIGTGNALKNIIAGNDQNNTLDGGLNADTMSGGKGNDVYYIDNKKDFLIENAGEGHDTAYTSVSWNMQANVEDVYVVADAALSITIKANASDNLIVGHAGIDKLSGLDGNDTLNGGAGADQMTGGNGNDVYYIDNVLDKVKESTSSTAGNDVAYSSVSWTLAKGVETLYLTGTNAIDAMGSTGHDIIYGNSAANTINGLKGNDTLHGEGGDDLLIGGLGHDHLFGGDGNDTLIGGLGADVLTGGAGADVFRFTSLRDSYVTSKVQEYDTITDFEVGIDKIDLSAIDADSKLAGIQRFTSIVCSDDAVFTGAGQMILRTDGTLLINTNTDPNPEMYINLTGISVLTLADFILQ